MILIEHAEGGLRLARWSGDDARPLETFFVAEDELAALLADLLARSTAASEGADWDLYAYLCGNAEVAVER